MDNDKFILIDGILATQGETDERESAMAILEVGVINGTLEEVARVVAGRYALRPQAVIKWYGEVLDRRIKATQEISDKLKELTKGYDGSR